MLIDTHAHLDFPDFADDLDAVLARAKDAGVTRVITIGTTIESSRRAVALAERYPQVFAVVGVHPNAAMEAGDDFVAELRELARESAGGGDRRDGAGLSPAARRGDAGCAAGVPGGDADE